MKSSDEIKPSKTAKYATTPETRNERFLIEERFERHKRKFKNYENERQNDQNGAITLLQEMIEFIKKRD